MQRLILFLLLSGSVPTMSSAKGGAPGSGVDSLVFGDAASEKAHGVNASASDTGKGLLDAPMRRFLPLKTPDWQGGTVSFTMKVDPQKQNYFTARFSGDEKSEDRLFLYVEGKQIGWRHLGDVDQLDFGSEEPAYAGRFYYNTSPLPQSLTKGKSELHCEIRSTGRIWGYGNTWEQYQKPMTEPSRGIYRLYTHTDGFFAPPTDEKQGAAPADSPIRQTPGVQVLDQIKQRVNHEVDKLLAAEKPISQMQGLLLARAYAVKWTTAWQKPQAISQITQALDGLYAAYLKNPKLAQEEPSTWNPGWFGLGVCGQIVTLRQAELQPVLDQQIDDGTGGKITRRAAWSQMLVATRDWHRLHRRQYTNQTMINDLNAIYYPNRGLAVLDPAQALPEAAARRYLYEAMAIEPWRDSDPGGHLWKTGENYFQLTDKGLTKELGYVGTYGEVLDLAAEIYNATRPTPDQPGDEKIKAQLLKIARARAVFRHPALDAEGHRAMRLEQIIGWRDSHYPGVMVYAQRATRDASALQVAAITLAPDLVGYAQQMLADNQFFQSEALSDTAQPLRTTIGRLDVPDEYTAIMAQPPSSTRLPMSWDQPDFVFTDEEDGVVALKNGSEILYVSLYWRARYGINNLARVHYLTPQFDRIAVVQEETQFEPSGMEFTWPNWTNMAFGGGGMKYPGDLQSAYAGQKIPIPKMPAGMDYQPGQESPLVGRGDFYTLRYGPYLIGLNMSKDKTFDLTIPADATEARDLVNKDTHPTPGAKLKVAPRTTAVLRLAD